ncbi:hypothetical protein BIW11_02794 [Tropilaelaps mercedesae]|uniref:Uncharacterized protein n=1 Tax=Tropilaelaps mercedesae TaxID=418985 RepID=A0A1V9XX55_9ACAR|nr:hypothetical protein BIW11_02794 [Tropilaelaps mercedesae]
MRSLTAIALLLTLRVAAISAAYGYQACIAQYLTELGYLYLRKVREEALMAGVPDQVANRWLEGADECLDSFYYYVDAPLDYGDHAVGMLCALGELRASERGG